MGILSYVYLKLGAILLRALARLQGKITSTPDNVCLIPSREKNRSIKAHLYQGGQRQKDAPRAVLINMHGSGFVIPAHGSDEAFCQQVSQQTDYLVLDIQYRLAPEYPFPAAVDDVEDVVKWVTNQPHKFDQSRIAISGFSAGGNLALVAASVLFPRETFRSVLAFYPSVEGFADSNALVAPEPGGTPLPPFALDLFKRCYLQNGVDFRDHRVSPGLVDADRFPANILIIAAGYDSLAPEAERLVQKLKGDRSTTRHIVYERMSECDHAWDKTAVEGTKQWELRDKAYKAAIAMLLR